MIFLPLFPLPFCGVYPLHVSGAVRAVFPPVGFGDKERPADSAAFPASPAHEGGFQCFIKGQDSEGRTYIVYPIAEIAEMLDKGCTTIKGALNELDAAGLLERRRTGFSCANRLYVKVPDIPVVQFSDQLTDGKPTLIRAGNRPTDSRKTDLMTVGKPSPNQTNINNLTENQTKRASEGQPPAAYGRYKNVFLSDTELLELEKDFPGKWEYYLDRLSCHIASTGKQYQNHAATIYKWAQEDAAKEKPKKGIPDYSFKEGESL